jgi:hypothetical protein
MTSAAVLTTVRRSGRSLLTPRLWALASVLTSVLIALLPLLWARRYYFQGDTQVAYSGWWYELGDHVLHGHIPLLNPQVWESGNYIAEGQWGLFSPLTILVAVVVRLSPNVVAVVILFKFALIMLGALGMYLLLRSYRLTPPVAYVGAVLVGLSGESVYYDWVAWVNGLTATALLPWAWWLTRRAMGGRNPLPALVLCYLIVSIGYVYAPLYLAVVVIACLVDAAASRNRAAILRVLGIGAFSALVVVTVYLPGVRTAPVTVRSGWDISSSGDFTVGVGDLLTSMLPTTNRFYLLWCLPLVLWIDWARARTVLREVRGAVVGTAILLAWALGPATIGPLRWPGRILPALMVFLVVVLPVVVGRSVRVPKRRHIVGSLAWLVAATWVVLSQDWSSGDTTLLGAAVVAAAILVLAWALRRRATVAALAAGACTVAVFVTQHAVTHAAGNDRHSPARAAGYRTQLASARGDVMVIGSYSDASYARPGLAKELLVGSTWYRNPAVVQNSYSTIRFRAFNEQFCRQYNGLTCRDLLKQVLAVEPTTGRPWVDLLSISTLVMYRPDFRPARLSRPPAGWTVAARSRWTVTWVRDHPLPTAGGVVWTSDSVRISHARHSDQTVRFRVDHVPAGGGTVVLSRLAWPGYAVTGASLADPTDKFLVTVHLQPSSTGRTVTVAWNPPGWGLERAAWWLAVVGGLAWSLSVVFLGRRRRRRDLSVT